MAYNTAFGALPGFKDMFGQSPGQAAGGVQSPQQPRQSSQTFAQLQQQGVARPAPPRPQAQPYQRYQGSQQGGEARTQMMTALQQQLAQPSRFDTEAFQQMRKASTDNLNAEFGGQRQLLDEEMARRGISASSITSGRYGDLLGQQARALATRDSDLLREAANTQAQDRAQLSQFGLSLADLAGAQDLQTYEANRVAQAAEFDQGMRGAEFEQGQYQFGNQMALSAAEAEQSGRNAEFQQQLQQMLGLGGLDIDAARLGLAQGEATGMMGGQQTLAARQFFEQQRQFDLQQQLQAQLGLGQLGLSEREVDLRAQQLQQEAAQQGRALSIEEARLQVQQSQFGQSLSEQQAARQQQFGLSQQELGLRAQQLQQEAQLQGRSLSIDEARLQAQNEQFAAQQGQQKEQFYAQLGINQQEVNLRAQQIQQEAQLQGSRLTLDQARLAAEQEQFTASLTETQAARLQQGGISQQDLALRARQIAQGDKSLSLEEARNVAEMDLQSRRLMQEAQLQGRSLTLEEARAEAQKAQFAAQLEESRAGRLAQLGVSGRELDLQAARLQQEAQLQGRSMDLQQARDQAEIGVRIQSLQQEAALQGRSLDLTQARDLATQGLERDRLKEVQRQTTLDESFRRAQLADQGNQFAADLGLRTTLGMGGLTLDERRVENERALANNQLMLQLSQLLSGLTPEQISQILGRTVTPPPPPPTTTLTTGGGGGTYTPPPNPGSGEGSTPGTEEDEQEPELPDDNMIVQRHVSADGKWVWDPNTRTWSRIIQELL